MTLTEIKAAVAQDKTVHWANLGYSVTKGLNIVFKHNDNCIGLTHRDGETLNGEEWQFFLAENGMIQQIEQLYKHICHELETINGTSTQAEVINDLTALCKLVSDYPEADMEDVWYLDSYMSIGIVDLIIGAYWYTQDSEHTELCAATAAIYTPNMATEPEEGIEEDAAALLTMQLLKGLKNEK